MVLQKCYYSLGLVLLLMVGITLQAYGATKTSPENQFAMENGYQKGVELEYFLPVYDERDLETISANYYYWHRNTEGRAWHFYRGITLTRSTGTVKRVADLEEESSAWGVGHVWLARHPWWQKGKLRLDFDASGALVLYDEAFPAGGTNLNFMWRVGPHLSYQVKDGYSWGVACKWLHVSNGQFWHFDDPENHNPGYNAAGLTVGVNW